MAKDWGEGFLLKEVRGRKLAMNELKMNHSWGETFKNALEGCLYAVKTQKNFTVHLIISFLVISLAVVLKISLTGLMLLIFAITFGLTVEMVNTALEKIVDMISPRYSSQAKIAKDISAGMMLVAAAGLAILGMIILLPPLFKLFL